MKKMKPSEKKIIVAFSLSSENVKAIDKECGRENRSSFVNRIIQERAGVKV